MSWKYNRVTVFFSMIRFYLLKRFYNKIIIGASGTGIKGYLKTEQKYLDVEYELPIKNLKEIIAEHVWEHLDFPSIATKRCYDALRYGGALTVAVPKDESIEDYKKYHHKHSFTPDGLMDIFLKQGFRAVYQSFDDKKIRRKNSIIVIGIK